MTKSNYDWQPVAKHDTKLVNDISNQCELPEVLANLLVDRGCHSVEEAEEFLQPEKASIQEPDKLHDMDKAVKRIRQAVEQGQKITIYGDYDADGITSTSVMYECLEMIGADVHYFVPNRFKDGYGPNLEEYKRLIDEGTELIITVDNGVSGYDEVAYANEHGVDVVITDHHELPDKLPDAVAIVHPHYPGDEYPYADLSGVGVAFKVAWGLLEEPPIESLDLVAIGEIADVVSMKGENHVLVAAGLRQLRLGQRPGLHALVQLTQTDESHLTDQDIGFQLAPRLNALGRISDANKGVQLLTTLDEHEAQSLAQEVDQCNLRRQQLVAQVLTEARQQANDSTNKTAKTLLILGKNWHQGVLGIVASHLVEETGKPTIVASANEGESVAKGSGRSIEHFDMFQALDGHRDLMTSFGGHTMACGLSFELGQVKALRTALEAEAETQGLKLGVRSQRYYAGQVAASDLDVDFYNQVQRLAPFGPDNEEPVFELSSPQITDAKLIGKEHQHLKLRVQAGTSRQLDILAFNQAKLVSELSKVPSQMWVTIGINRWKGQENAQLMLVDSQTEIEDSNSVQWKDWRGKTLSPDEFQEDAVYVIFNERLLANVQGNVEWPVYSDQQVMASKIKGKNVIIVDCPPDISRFSALLLKLKEAGELRLQLSPVVKHPQIKLPDRQHFIKFFNLIREQGPLDLNNHFKDLCRYLWLQQEQVNFMITVFLELNFVTMKNGFLKLNDQLQQGSIKDTKTYRTQAAWQEVNRVLLQSPAQQLGQWITAHLH